LYALHRLKLQTTGRGLLLIATLLVPLNFLVMAGLSEEERQAQPLLRVVNELIAMAVFVGLMRPAAQALLPAGRWPLILAVLGISVSPLAVPWLLRPGDTDLWPVLWLGALPIVIYLASAARVLGRVAGRGSLDISGAYSIFAFLGLVTFPLVVALGF